MKDYKKNRLIVKKKAKFCMNGAVFGMIAASFLPVMLSLVISMIIDAPGLRPLANLWVISIDGREVSLSINIALALGLLITAPLELGMLAYFMRHARMKEPKLSEIFEWVGNSKKLVCAMRYTAFRIMFTIAVFVLTVYPDFLAGDIAKMSEKILAGDAVSPISSRLVLLAAGSFALMFLLQLPFAPLGYIIADNPDKGIFSSIAQSLKIMRGHYIEFTLLIFSFVGWMLASPFTCYLLIFVIVPYYNISAAVYFDRLRFPPDGLIEKPSEAAGEGEPQ